MLYAIYRLLQARTRMTIRLCTALTTLLTPLALSQTEAEDRTTESYILLEYPRDEDRAIAKVDGREITLEEMVRHIEERHRPGFRQFLSSPAGNLYFRSPTIATWVRQYADVVALKSEARSRNLDFRAAEQHLADALKSGFEAWLQAYVEGREQQGRPVTLDQDRIDRLLTDFQNDFGLETEVQGWLDFLVPDDKTAEEVRDYYTDHARIFGGRITIAHILIYDRDPYTGILLDGDAKIAAAEKLADVRARLRKDGSNFEEVASLLSDDRRTAVRGGLLANVARFDPYLPAALCRKGWYLADGEVSEPFRSRYGTHIVKKISFEMNTFVLWTEEIQPRVRQTMRQHGQENLLFDLRERRRVELLY